MAAKDLAMSSLLKIGTRRSPLALAQAREVQARLAALHGAAAERLPLVPFVTTGDRLATGSLAEIGGKGLFTKEIDEALLSGAIDLAVHSLKDMPTLLPGGLALGACLPREDPRDAFLSPKAESIADLPRGAVVGTSSLRRSAQLLATRRDLQIAPLRGNVGTRLEKLARGEVDATLLAMAGLKRLGLTEKVRAVLAPEEMLPAVGQGILAVLVRQEDTRVAELVRGLDDRRAAIAAAAERAFLAVLDGSCRTPIAGLAETASGIITFRGAVLAPDGSRRFDILWEGPAADPALVGRAAGEALKAKAGAAFLGGLAGGR